MTRRRLIPTLLAVGLAASFVCTPDLTAQALRVRGPRLLPRLRHHRRPARHQAHHQHRAHQRH